MARYFTCDKCGATYESAWTDADARAEQLDAFGPDMPGEEEPAVLCDACYQAFMAWFRKTAGRN